MSRLDQPPRTARATRVRGRSERRRIESVALAPSVVAGQNRSLTRASPPRRSLRLLLQSLQAARSPTMLGILGGSPRVLDARLGECSHWSSVIAGKPKSPRSAATRLTVCGLGARGPAVTECQLRSARLVAVSGGGFVAGSCERVRPGAGTRRVLRRGGRQRPPENSRGGPPGGPAGLAGVRGGALFT